MQILEQFYTIIVIACLLLLMSFKDILTSRLLRWVLFLLLYSECIRIIGETGASDTSAFVIMTGYLARSLFIPAAYLYLRNHFDKRQLVKQDLVNLIPCAVFAFGCLIAYLANGNLNFLLNSEDKHAFSRFSGDQVALLGFRLFVYCLTGFYLWLVLLMLKKNYRTAEKGTEFLKVNSNVNGTVNVNGTGNINGFAPSLANGNVSNGNGHNGHTGDGHGHNGNG